jgi:hypothetical protein
VPSEGDPKREVSRWWDPLDLLSPPSPTPLLHSITCLTATPRCPPTPKIVFDTDSGAMGIDNRCSVCMSHIKADFVGELIQDRLAVTGFHGTETCTVYKSTIKVAYRG